eukprot:gene22407-28530_t
MRQSRCWANPKTLYTPFKRRLTGRMTLSPTYQKCLEWYR